MNPVLKWVGGKRRLLPQLVRLVPANTRIVELFAGGAALSFHMEDHACVLNDKNARLMQFYEVLRESPEQLFETACRIPVNETEYYRVRANKPSTALQSAANFLYLNKTAFNGIWRENASGGMNVPFCKRNNVSMPSFAQMVDASVRLSTASLLSGSFVDVPTSDGDFIYADPPYLGRFTDYTSNGFNLRDMQMLREYLVSTGLPWVLSHSDHAVVNELFSDFAATSIDHNYIVGSKNEYRGAVKERLFSHGVLV